ncbi:MAG: universal stress protein [Thermomicrobiales bacterium]|nr:universal stress protein [Thermomicrobiales bacterium]
MDEAQVTDTLLVPLDGSQMANQAVPFAAAMAGPDARFVLLRVLASTGPIEEMLTPERSAEVRGAAENEALRSLEDARMLLPADANVELSVVSGNPADAIVATAASRGIGAIVVATHARGAVGRWVFGSVADRIARASSVPVLIVRAAPDAALVRDIAFRRVVVPLDGSQLALDALRPAAAIARAHDLPILLLTAVDLARLTPMAPAVAMPIPGNIYEEMYEEITDAAHAALKEAAANPCVAGLAVTTEVRVGSPFVAIETVVNPGDVIVLTSHGRSGVRRWLLGSVAEQLVRDSPAPIVIVPATGRPTETPETSV